MTGSTLKEYIARSPFTGLDAYTALILMQNLLRILLYLQSKHVIHNDIKGTMCRMIVVVVITVSCVELVRVYSTWFPGSHCKIRQLGFVLFSWPATMWWPAIVVVCVVRLSVCHMWISAKVSEIDVWLLGNTNRNLGFPIQNLPSDLRSDVQFRHFGCFQVGTSHIQTEIGQLS